MVYRFDEKSIGNRFSFAYQKDHEWNPFFDSFIARPQRATSVLFIYPFSNSSAEGYSIRRLTVPLPDQNGKPEIVGD